MATLPTLNKTAQLGQLAEFSHFPKGCRPPLRAAIQEQQGVEGRSTTLELTKPLMPCLCLALFTGWAGWGETPKLYSRGQAAGSPCLLCYVSVLGTHLCQCTSWHCCERLHLASVKLFGRLSMHLPFHDG